MEEQTIYQRAVIKWGVDSQVDMLIEELAELIVELQHCKRNRSHNVAEEIADVEIMLSQIKPLFNEDKDVDNWKLMKAERLEKRLIA